jgi:hypothetical protein
MPSDRRRAMTVLGAALSALALPTLVGMAPAHGGPDPGVCNPTAGNGNVCTARMTSVTASSTDGTITGTPVGGAAPVTFWGEADAYLKSQGFGNAPPDPIQRWDATIDGVNGADMSGPGWYGAAKSRAFLSRSLNELASQFPPDVIVVRFVPDDTHAGWFRLVSIQPIAP